MPTRSIFNVKYRQWNKGVSIFNNPQKVNGQQSIYIVEQVIKAEVHQLNGEIQSSYRARQVFKLLTFDLLGLLVSEMLITFSTEPFSHYSTFN